MKGNNHFSLFSFALVATNVVEALVGVKKSQENLTKKIREDIES